MSKEEKKIIEEPIYIGSDLSSIFDGNTIDEVIKNVLDIQKILNEHPMVANNPGKYFNFKVNYDSPYEGYDTISFLAMRYETDKELADRIEKNKEISEAKEKSDKKKKEIQEKRERSTLAALKKKYESKQL